MKKYKMKINGEKYTTHIKEYKGHSIIVEVNGNDYLVELDTEKPNESTPMVRSQKSAPEVKLSNPQYAGLLVTENPATSSPGLAFLMATIAQFGEEGYLEFWSALVDNGLVVVNDWETAYYTNFSGSSGQGPQPFVVSYGSSPAAEVYFSEDPAEGAPTASIIGPNTCFRQIEFVGILNGTENRDLAEAWVDFMLSVPFQEDIPLQMFVFPVNSNAKLPQVFLDTVQIPDQPATLPIERINQNREAWIEAWTETVLE